MIKHKREYIFRAAKYVMFHWNHPENKVWTSLKIFKICHGDMASI